jgi:purine-cytosine permease-like protein
MEHQEMLPDSPSSADTELRQPLEVEYRGVPTIPEEERRTTPWTFFVMLQGAGVALGSIAFGWLPIALGLGAWGALFAITVGTIAGLLPLALLILIGSRTATNNSTSSGAHFGVRGRLIGTTLGLFLMPTSTAIGIWASGGVLVAAAARLFHTPTGDGALTIGYLLLTGFSIVIAVYGYHLLVRVTRWLMVGGGLVALLMLVAFAGRINLGYKGGQYALGSFGSTWLLAALATGVGGVMFIVTVVGDSTRYISARRYPPRRLLPVALLGVAVSYIVPMGIGAVVTTAFADPYAPWPQSLVTASPTWYAWLLLPMALFGGLGWSAWTIYSCGLDLDAMIARHRGAVRPEGDRETLRARTTTIMGVASLALVLLGSLVWDASESITAASLILLAVSAPWAAVVGVGYLRCRGEYFPEDLQVWISGGRGGAYWYRGGWNPAAVIAWVAGSVFGVLAVHTTLYVGPWAGVAKGVDISFVGSFALAAIIYPALESLPLFGARGTLGASTAPEAKV